MAVSAGAPRPTATADVWPHPLTAAGRRTRRLAVRPGTTLAEFAARAWPGARPGDAAAAVDGRPVADAGWAGVTLAGGETVTLRARLGDGGDSDPLRAVLRVAALAAAAYVPGLPVFAGAGALGRAAVGAATLAAGGLIADALAPPRPPARPQAADPEPAYSLAAGANRARAYAPLPVVVGRHRMFPDLAARPHSAFRDGAQYLGQIFHFGIGDVALSDLRIGETPIAAFEEARTEWAGPDGRIGLVAGNVDSEAVGAALDWPEDADGAPDRSAGARAEWTVRRSAANARRVEIDLTGQLLRVDARGSARAHTAEVEIRYRRDGAAAWTTLRREVAGAADGPTRRTVGIDLDPAGSFEVGVRRAAPPPDDDRVREALSWAVLRSFQPDAGDYRGQRRLAVEIRATGQIHGRLDRLSALASQKIPVWDGARWTAPVESSNPAAVFRWYALGLYVAGRLAFGIGLAEERLDGPSIEAWYEWCQAEGLRCDAVIDRAMSHAEMLEMICQCGRAGHSWATGRLGAVTEAPRPRSALVAPGNVVAGSFAVDWAGPVLADEIVCEYVDPDFDWQVNRIRRAVPGTTAPAASATLRLAGVTTRRQAAMECNLAAARQLHHRRRLSWEMGREGLAIARGDVVAVAHSLIDGGAAGRLRAVDAARTGLVLDRPVALAGAGDRLLLRLPWGALHDTGLRHPDGPGLAGETAAVVAETPLPEPPSEPGADRPVDTLWRFYDRTLPPTPVRVIAAAPVGDDRVRFTAIDESAAWHAAAKADLSAPLPTARARAPRVVAAAVGDVPIRAGMGWLVEIVLDLTVAGDWRGASVRAALDGGPARPVAALVDGATEARWVSPPSGRLTITIVPGSSAAPAGPPFTLTHAIVGVAAPPAAPSNFLIDVLGDGTRRFRWTPPPDADVVGYELRHSEQTAPAWDAMTPLHAGVLTSSPYETVDPRAGNWRFALRARDAAGNLSDPVWISADLPDTRAGGRFWWDCPSADGWPGTVAGGVRSNDGRDALEGVGDYDWADLTNWAAWRSWGAGDGTQAGRAMTYTPPPVDLRAALPFTLDQQAESVGTVAFEVRTGGSAAAPVWGAWAAYANRRLLTARHVQVRWRLTGDGSQVLSLDHVCWQALGTADTEQVLDSNTANWAGSAAAGRVVPLDRLALVTGLAVTLQNVGAGWTWELLNKTEPRIRIYNGAGATRDATVDVIAYGVARQTGDSA